MILAVDAGNTVVRLGCVESGEVKSVSAMEMRRSRTSDEYAVLMGRILELHGLAGADFEGAAISSVVPPLTGALREAVRMVTGREALVVGAGVRTGLNIGIDDPSELGADLVASAVAALELYGAPAIVVDVGTATTMSVIGPNARLLGGAIMPGPDVSAEALYGAASLLPRVPLDAPARCIGRNTVDCMRSGAVFGAAAAIDGMIERMERELGGPAKVVATGALASRIVPHCAREMELDEHMALKGLALIWKRNQAAPGGRGRARAAGK